MVPIGSLISTSILAAAALVVLGASSAALVTNAPPTNSRRPICGIGFLRAECRRCQNRERTGVPKRAARLGWWMRPDQSGLRTKYHRQSNLIAVIRSLPLAVLTFSVGFLYFYGKNMSRPKHVRTKDDPFHIRSEGHVWFKTIVVLG